MAYFVITVSVLLLLIGAPIYFGPLLFWNLGFWSRFIGFKEVKLPAKDKIQVMLGIPLTRMRTDMTGAMLQIAAYLIAVEAAVLSLLIQNRVWLAGIYFALFWPSIWLALEIVKLLVRKLA